MKPLKPFDPSEIDNPIGKSNIETLTDISFKEWCEFAISAAEVADGFISYKEIELSGEYPRFCLRAKTDYIHFVINFDVQTLRVYNHQFTPEKPYVGTGRRMLERQLELAEKMGLQRIDCWAFGGKGVSSKYHGHISWALWGFSMSPYYHEKFMTLKTEWGRQENCLQKLLLSRDGLNLWRREGLSWRGTFSVEEKSYNRRLLRMYDNFKVSHLSHRAN